MSVKRDREINHLLNAAESNKSCLVVTDRVLKEALERRVGDKLTSPRPRLYARKTYWEKLGKAERERHVIRGLAKLHPSWTFCHASAATMHELPVSLWRLKRAHVLTGEPIPRSKSRDKTQRHYHKRASLMSTTDIGGVRCTSLEDTIVDCLLAFNFRDGLAIADAALARLGNDGERLEKLVRERGRRRPGLRQALETIRWADARSESGGESIARAVMIEHGFMLPKLQVVVGDPSKKGESWRCDYFWVLSDGTRVAGELDGLEKYTNPEMTKGQSVVEVMSKERIRESQLTLAVDRVLRFTWDGVKDEQRLVAKLEQFGIPRTWPTAPAIDSSK